MDQHPKEDVSPRGRFGKSTRKTLQYCPHCIRCESNSAIISVLTCESACFKFNDRVLLSMNKRKRWEILPPDILCTNNEEKKTDEQLKKKKKKTKTFTTPQKHWRSEIGFYQIPDIYHYFGKYQQKSRWSKQQKAYDTKPIPLAMEARDVHKYKISTLFRNEIPNDEVPLYILENTHTLWEQSKLYDVNVSGRPFLEWHVGCGEYVTSGWWGKKWKDVSSLAKEKVVVLLPTRKKVGRWCCCRKGKTGDNYGFRNVYGYGTSPALKRNRKKEKRRMNRIVKDIYLNV